MRLFIADHLGPALEEASLDVPLWIYDQNREEIMMDWAKAIYEDEKATKFVRGMAVHWYQSTIDVGGEILDAVHEKYPTKEILHSEGCIDALGDDEPIGAWLEDDWYWRPEATDWGKFWAPAEDKKDHPPYRAFYRYTRDLIGGLNHNLVGWIDWNMVLDRQGGPNWFENWCVAPVIVDPDQDEVYFTPLYYTMAHFSKYIRPGAVRIGFELAEDSLMVTAAQNPDGSIVVVMLNQQEEPKEVSLTLGEESTNSIQISGQAVQTLIIPGDQAITETN